MDTSNKTPLHLITRQIPNAITAMRVILSFVLLILQPLSVGFFIIFSLCVFSDAADGFIARKLSIVSKLGAILDSIADAIFIGVMGIILIPLFTFPSWTLVWMACIALIRFCSLLIGYCRYRSLTFLHTYANKITGLVLYCFPLLLNLFDFIPAVIVISFAATFSAMEELIINATSRTLDLNISSIIGRGGKPANSDDTVHGSC